MAEAVAELHRARRASHEHHGQPSGGDRPLPPLAALADGEREEDRLAAARERFIANYRGSAGRAVVSFEYVGGEQD